METTSTPKWMYIGTGENQRLVPFDPNSDLLKTPEELFRPVQAEMVKACGSGDLELAENILERHKERREDLLKLGFREAVEKGQIDVVRFLFDSGLLVEDVKDSVMERAIKHCDIALLNLVYNFGWRPSNELLRYAALREKSLEWLLDHGAEPEGSAALESAAGIGTVRAIDMLLAKGASVKDGIPLHRAAQAGAPHPGRIAVMERLVEAGCGVNRFDHDSVNWRKQRGTPLNYACATGSIAEAWWLLEHGAVEALEKYGRDWPLRQAGSESRRREAYAEVEQLLAEY